MCLGYITSGYFQTILKSHWPNPLNCHSSSIQEQQYLSHRIFKKRLNTTKFCFKVVHKNVKKIWPAHTPLDCSFIYFFPNTAVVIEINSSLSARQVTMIPVHMQYKDSMVTVSIYRSDNRHRRTGLEILGADTNLPDSPRRRENL